MLCWQSYCCCFSSHHIFTSIRPAKEWKKFSVFSLSSLNPSSVQAYSAVVFKPSNMTYSIAKNYKYNNDFKNPPRNVPSTHQDSISIQFHETYRRDFIDKFFLSVQAMGTYSRPSRRLRCCKRQGRLTKLQSMPRNASTFWPRSFISSIKWVFGRMLFLFSVLIATFF